MNESNQPKLIIKLFKAWKTWALFAFLFNLNISIFIITHFTLSKDLPQKIQIGLFILELIFILYFWLISTRWRVGQIKKDKYVLTAFDQRTLYDHYLESNAQELIHYIWTRAIVVITFYIVILLETIFFILILLYV